MNRKIENTGSVYNYLIFIVIIFIILVIRLFFIQIINANEYKTQSSNNTLKLIDIPSKRGDIFDRNNEPLAINKPMASIAIDINSSKEDYEKTIYNLSNLLFYLGYNEQKIKMQIDKKQVTGTHGIVEILKVSYDKGEGIELISKIYESKELLPAIEVQIIPTRYYPQGNLLGVTLGYVGAISQEEYEKNKDIYKPTDILGKIGLEKSLEQFKKEGTNLKGLHGIKGSKKVETNIQGKTVNTKKEIIPSIPGDCFQLTIDSKIQKILEDSLEEQIKKSKLYNDDAGSGAAILLDVQTGEILAMASKPYFDPNDFTNGLSLDKSDYYIKNNKTPMVNKVLNTAYPPGSVFKLVTGIAGLTYSDFNEDSTFTCTGKFWESPYIPCTGIHGLVNLEKALQVSCNVYFQAISQKTGIENISKIAKQLGLGVDTGFTDILGVSKGFLPTPDSKSHYEKEYLEGLKEIINTEASDKIISINQNFNFKEEEKRTKIEKIETEKQQKINSAISNYEWSKNWYPYDTYNLSIGQGMNNYTILQLGQYISSIANGGIRYKPILVKKGIISTGEVVYEAKPKILNKLNVKKNHLDSIKAGMMLVTKEGGTAGTIFNNCSINVAGKTGTAETGRVNDNKLSDFHGVFIGFAPYDNPKIAIAVIVEYGWGNSNSAALVARNVFESYFNY